MAHLIQYNTLQKKKKSKIQAIQEKNIHLYQYKLHYFCLCDLYGSRDAGFVEFCQCREHFLFIMICVSLMDGLTENKASHKPRAHVYFRLKESQPFRGMVSILVLNKKVYVIFSFPLCTWRLTWPDVCFRSSWY